MAASDHRDTPETPRYSIEFPGRSVQANPLEIRAPNLQVIVQETPIDPHNAADDRRLLN
jgi:hypothetical protein